MVFDVILMDDKHQYMKIHSTIGLSHHFKYS